MRADTLKQILEGLGLARESEEFEKIQKVWSDERIDQEPPAKSKAIPTEELIAAVAGLTEPEIQGMLALVRDRTLLRLAMGMVAAHLST